MKIGSPPSNRRGNTYVLVLGLSALVVTLAMGAIAVARIRARRTRAAAEVAQSRLLAQAAVQVGRLIVKTDPDWRDHHPNGTWGVGWATASGSATLSVVDPDDGDLADDELQPVVVTGAGTIGLTHQKVRVTLLAEARGFGCLQTALHANNDVELITCTVQCDQTVSANNDVDASGADVRADAEAANTVSGGTYHGTTASGVDPRSMPDPATVFNRYGGRGTWINRWNIPWDDGARVIEEVVLSPGHNPYWPYTTNPDGIYCIDCGGYDVRIRNCRIVGTLVLVNAGSDTRVAGSVNWKPAVANYPALLVDGNLRLALSAGALDEERVLENFNPSHTPYQGTWDSDIKDFYPSRIKGLIYAEDDAFAGPGTHSIHGLLVTGNTFTAEPGSILNLRYDPTCANDPPPAFRERIDMTPAEGSYERMVD